MYIKDRVVIEKNKAPSSLSPLPLPICLSFIMAPVKLKSMSKPASTSRGRKLVSASTRSSARLQAAPVRTPIRAKQPAAKAKAVAAKKAVAGKKAAAAKNAVGKGKKRQVQSDLDDANDANDSGNDSHVMVVDDSVDLRRVKKRPRVEEEVDVEEVPQDEDDEEVEVLPGEGGDTDIPEDESDVEVSCNTSLIQQ